MAAAVLVDRDLDIGRKVIGVLAGAGIPVTVAFWAYIPQIDEWQFFVATSLVDSKGPKLAYEQVLKVLQREGVNGDLPWRRIFLRSPKDPGLRSIGRQAEMLLQEGFLGVNASVGDRFIEDAYVYGTIFIVKAGILRPNRREFYSVIYTPRSSQRPPVPPLRFRSLEEVRTFLEGELRLDSSTVQQKTEELSRNMSVVIPVTLTSSQLRAAGFA